LREKYVHKTSLASLKDNLSGRHYFHIRVVNHLAIQLDATLFDQTPRLTVGVDKTGIIHQRANPNRLT